MIKYFIPFALLTAFFFAGITVGYSNGVDGIEEANQLLKESKKYRDTDKQKTMSLLNKALDIYQKNDDAEGLAKTFLAISSWYINENQWDTSLSLSLRALKYGDQLNDSLIQSRVFLNLGIIYFNLKNYKTSKKYSLEAILYGDGRIKASATANIGMVCSSKNEPDSAFSYFYRANQLFLNLNDSSKSVISNIAITNMNMGTIALEKENFADAKKYFNKSLISCYSINDYNSIILNYLNFGNVFTIEEKFDLAEEMVLRARSIADSAGLTGLQNLSLHALSSVYYSKGDYKQSYKMLDKFVRIKDSLTGVDIGNKIANLQMKYEVEKQQQQIFFLENEKKLSIYRTIFIVFITLLLAAIFIFYLNKRRLNTRRRMAKAEQNRKETQKKLEKAKEDIIHYTKLVQENNERIECFEEELLNTNKEDSDELKKKQEKLRGMKILKDEDWVYYKNLFKEVDNTFYDKVMSIPNMTEGDKRQILLLKLGYTNKMSADVLGISTEGIKRARQRLAKKLDLKDAGKLEDYFLSL